MAWHSQRSTDRWAKELGAKHADHYEEQLGRKLTPDELRQVYEQAAEAAQKIDDRNRVQP